MVKVHAEPTDLDEVLLIRPDEHTDERGYFTEVFRSDVWREAGLPTDFVQVNQSGSKAGVIRGLHFQHTPPMGKAMRVIRGRAFLVAADVRKSSPTVGEWVGRELAAADRAFLWAPAGFARGFCALADPTEIEYFCTATYNPEGEGGVRWDDPAIGIEWPVEDPVLSDRDGSAPSLEAWLASAESGRLVYGD